MKTIRKEAAVRSLQSVESVTFTDGTTVSGKEVNYNGHYAMEVMVFNHGKWTNYRTYLRDLPRKEVASYVPFFYQDLARHEVFETTDKLFYGGLLVVFEKEYFRLEVSPMAKSQTFKGEFYKNKKGLVIFKADENGSKTLEISHSKRRGRFYEDETIIAMEAESGYTSGFYKDWHWKIK